MSRPLYEIAREVRSDWRSVSPYAKPYLDAMRELSSIEDAFYLDSGKEIVGRFLSNSASWKGEVARRVKLELKGMLK